MGLKGRQAMAVAGTSGKEMIVLKTLLIQCGLKCIQALAAFYSVGQAIQSAVVALDVRLIGRAVRADKDMLDPQSCQV